MSDGLSKQVESPQSNAELVALKQKTNLLQVLYAVLFGLSIAVIVYQYSARGHVWHGATALWACSLGGAVIVRLVRQSLVNKYNRILMGGQQGPLT